jgi:hypothetical protein
MIGPPPESQVPIMYQSSTESDDKERVDLNLPAALQWLSIFSTA